MGRRCFPAAGSDTCQCRNLRCFVGLMVAGGALVLVGGGIAGWGFAIWPFDIYDRPSMTKRVAGLIVGSAGVLPLAYGVVCLLLYRRHRLGKRPERREKEEMPGFATPLRSQELKVYPTEYPYPPYPPYPSGSGGGVNIFNLRGPSPADIYGHSGGVGGAGGGWEVGSVREEECFASMPLTLATMTNATKIHTSRSNSRSGSQTQYDVAPVHGTLEPAITFNNGEARTVQSRTRTVGRAVQRNSATRSGSWSKAEEEELNRQRPNLMVVAAKAPGPEDEVSSCDFSPAPTPSYAIPYSDAEDPDKSDHRGPGTGGRGARKKKKIPAAVPLRVPSPDEMYGGLGPGEDPIPRRSRGSRGGRKSSRGADEPPRHEEMLVSSDVEDEFDIDEVLAPVSHSRQHRHKR